jgi:streptomycin 6-kinase
LSDAETPWLNRPPWGMSAQLAARMERIAREVAAEWGLTIGPRIKAGRYSYVANAGTDAILKIVPSEADDADHIADALRFWDGDGAVRLLRHDPARRALLLERARPGTEAAEASEEEAIAAAVGVGTRIWRTPPTQHSFRSVHDWVRRWLPPDDAHPLVPVARQVFEAMDPRIDTLIHADFHHHNLLRHGAGWIAIDPKPIVGEPEFDVPAFLWNPLGTSSSRARTEGRIRAFAAAGLDEEKIRGWAIVRGVCDGLPLRPDKTDETSKQLRVVRELL